MKKAIYILLALSLLFSLKMNFQADSYETRELPSPLYVDLNGVCNGNSPCYTSIQKAIDDVTPGSTIRIAAGTYGEELWVSSSGELTLEGGWNNDFTDRSSNTLINSLTITDDGQIIVDRLTIVSPTTSADIAKMPEVYTAAVSQAVIDQYKQLLSPLPIEAKKWITGMGWGLEDLILDSNEIALLECLSSKNTSSILSILTKPNIIDGLTLSELTWAQGYQVASLSEVLKEDIDELKKKEFLSSEGLAGIQTLIGMAATDFEIAKGLYLIGNFGHPNADIFSYSVPDYNTQLYILGQLVELGIPAGYEVAAVAAALDYGTLWSIADNDLRLVIAQYAHDIIAYQNQTDVIMKPYNVPKQAKLLSLEAQIGLVWGAPGNYYALTEEEGATKQYGFWKGYREIFSTRPMSVSDFEFLFTEIETLVEMRKYILANSLFKSDAGALSCEISKFWYRDNLIYNSIPAIIEVEGRMIYNSYICNMDWQWNRFKNKGKFTGGSGDAYIHTFLLKSLNYSAITIAYLVHISGHFDPLDNSWKADTYELSLADYQKTDSRLGWNRVPYDNFWSNPIVGHYTGRIRFLVPLQASVVWSNGVPKGYIFRADLSSEPYPPI